MTTDGSRLELNWNPARPLREVLRDEPLIKAIVPVGEYPGMIPAPIEYQPHNIKAVP